MFAGAILPSEYGAGSGSAAVSSGLPGVVSGAEDREEKQLTEPLLAAASGSDPLSTSLSTGAIGAEKAQTRKKSDSEGAAAIDGSLYSQLNLLPKFHNRYSKLPQSAFSGLNP